MTTKQLAVTTATNIEKAPGWVALSQEKKEWLAGKTTNIANYKRLEGLAALGGSIELEEVERALKGEPLNLTTYVHHVYGGSGRTAFRRLADLKELRRYWSDPIIKGIAANGAVWLRGASGSGMKDVINVAKQLPAPKSTEATVIEGFVAKKVREKLREQRSGRRVGKKLRLNDEDAARAALNALLRYFRAARLDTAADKRRWLANVAGWAMDAEAIPGTLTVTRKEVPEGYLVVLGRPRKKPK